mmetsp:Transcript_33778/g.90480  ORF Transcript_33778/g.90480 Transcript_33778/m.90480 type:complete len:222 (-) Transcript_33778:179-844(-)
MLAGSSLGESSTQAPPGASPTGAVAAAHTFADPARRLASPRPSRRLLRTSARGAGALALRGVRISLAATTAERSLALRGPPETLHWSGPARRPRAAPGAAAAPVAAFSPPVARSRARPWAFSSWTLQLLTASPSSTTCISHVQVIIHSSRLMAPLQSRSSARQTRGSSWRCRPNRLCMMLQAAGSPQSARSNSDLSICPLPSLSIFRKICSMNLRSRPLAS